MKNNVLKLEGHKVYVLDELTYKNKMYIFTIELDENEEPIEDNVNVFEVNVEDEKLIAEKIEDFEISSIVSNMFIKRQMENKNS